MKSVLIIIPYEELYPPMNGGMLRCFHVMRQLSKSFQVTVITHQELSGFKEALVKYPELQNCTIISTKNNKRPKDIFSLLPAKLTNSLRFRYWKRSFTGPADSNFLRYYPLLINLVRKHTYNYTILENLGSLHAVPVIRKFNPSSIIIYNAHNVDSALLRDLVGVSAVSIKKTIQLESSLSKMVDCVMTCSEPDLSELKRMNKHNLEGIVVPNGIEMKNRGEYEVHVKSAVESLIFVGSLDYGPNRQGLMWFCTKILAGLKIKKPLLKLIVIGNGHPGQELKEILLDSGVNYHGKVENVEEYYRKAAIAIVPLISGSGTRLKILEAMSYRVPVIATSKGGEGIDYTNGENIYIADNENTFSEAILNLLENKEQADALASEAYKLVENKYDWDIIGKKLSQFLTENSNYQNSEIAECRAKD